MPSVDVAIPCYQYGRYLEDCVTSILRQEIRDLRILVIDNASTDNTREVAERMSARDSRVQIVSHATNLGHHASFNEGMDWARAKYFMLLGADDCLSPGALARAISTMEKDPSVNLTHGAEYRSTFDQGLPDISQPRAVNWQLIKGIDLIERLCRTGRCHIMAQTVVVRTAAQKSIGHYRASLSHTDDLEMWLRFASLGNVAETNAIQGVRRLHPDNRSSSIANVHQCDILVEQAFQSFFAHEGARLPDSRRLQKMAKQALSDRAYWGALANLVRGDFRLSRDLMVFALSRTPSSALLPPINYLWRRRDAIQHIGQVVSDRLGGSSAPRTVEHLGGPTGKAKSARA
jgi:glycosyltransferase involved in cell wall biosynthesis